LALKEQNIYFIFGFTRLVSAALISDPGVVADIMRDTEEKTRQLIQKYSVKMKASHVSNHLYINERTSYM